MSRGNQSAKVVAEELRRLGCRVWTSGWPDLLVLRGASLCAIEVKFEADKPSREQLEVAELLCRNGLPTFEVHNRATGSVIDRCIEQRFREGGATSIILADKLYEAVAAAGAQPVPDVLFAAQRKNFRTGVCSSCDLRVVMVDDPGV
jgi:hypothetical protein